MLLTLLVVTSIALAVYFYITVKEKQRYFERIGLPYLKPTFLLGNVWSILAGRESLSVFINRIYFENEGRNLIGVYNGTTPIIILRDPQLINTVIIKEFSNFHDRGFRINEDANPLEGILFSVSGNKWRTLRNKLSPTFTSGRIKSMLELMEKCTDAFLADLGNNLNKELDVRNQFMKLTAQVIGVCAFGIDTDSIRDENSDFIRFGLKILQPGFKEFFVTMTRDFYPSFDKIMGFKTIPQEVNDFFSGLVKDTMDYRKKTGCSTNDFLQLLLELKEKAELEVASKENGQTAINENDKLFLNHDVVTAQAVMFIVAGFETTASTLGFLSYELSKNIQIQEKLREEIKSVKEKYGNFTYDVLNNMPYLDAVINETLRLWPADSALFRVCTKTTTLTEDLTIEKGVRVFMPIGGIQRDSQYYSEPSAFKPERFLDQQPSHLTFLTFGDGPRKCIGERFARLQLKIATARLLDEFKIETCEKMASLEPIQFKVTALINVPRDGVYCVFKRLEQ